jgi:Na+-driven multidrug efflux pump
MMRVVYLILAIPFWGYSTAINTIVSNTIGKKREKRVLNQVHHSALISFITSAIFAVPVLLLPFFFLNPILGKQDVSLLRECVPYFHLLLVIFLLNAITTMYFNGVSGTGEAMKGLKIQSIATIFYLGLAFWAVQLKSESSLYLAWSAEIVYWIIQLSLSYVVLKSGKWHFLKI